MALLTFGGAVARGTPQSVTLNKSAVTGMAAVSGDSFWSNAANIKTAIVIYETGFGDRRRIVFDFTQSTPSASIEFSSVARQSWSVTEVILRDFDGGVLTLKQPVLQAQIPGGIAGLGLDLGPLGGGSGLATDLGLYYDIDSSGPFTIGNPGFFTTNEYSYSVSGGVMSLSYHLESPVVAGLGYNGTTVGGSANAQITTNGYGAGIIALPPGYAFDPSVTTYSTSYGTGVYAFRNDHFGSPAIPYILNCKAKNNGEPRGFYVSWDAGSGGGYSWGADAWSNSSSNWLSDGKVKIQFTASVPVVSV